MLVVLENAGSEEGETLGRWVASAVLGLVSGSRGEREACHPAHVLRELSETVSGQGRCLKSTLATLEGQKASEAGAQLSGGWPGEGRWGRRGPELPQLGSGVRAIARIPLQRTPGHRSPSVKIKAKSPAVFGAIVLRSWGGQERKGGGGNCRER